MTKIKINPLQSSDDQHFFEQPGSTLGIPETLIHEDSPDVILEKEAGKAKEGIIDPTVKGTRDGQYDEVNDINKNLREKFVNKGVIDAQSR